MKSHKFGLSNRNLAMTNDFRHAVDASLPRRYFWRRAAAFLIDGTAFYLLLAVVAWLCLAAGWDPGFSIGRSVACTIATPSALTDEVDREWPLGPGETRINQLCVIAPWPGEEQRLFTSTVNAGQGTSNITRNLSVELDENGNAVAFKQSWLSGATRLLFKIAAASMFAFTLAKITSTGRRSLGKSWMSLRIVATDGSVPSLARCVKRETSKFLPPVLVPPLLHVLVMIRLNNYTRNDGEGFAEMIRAAQNMPLEFWDLFMLQAVLMLAISAWLFGAFILWRGQTFYDRLVGCFVIRQ